MHCPALEHKNQLRVNLVRFLYTHGGALPGRKDIDPARNEHGTARPG